MKVSAGHAAPLFLACARYQQVIYFSYIMKKLRLPHFSRSNRLICFIYKILKTVLIIKMQYSNSKAVKFQKITVKNVMLNPSNVKTC
jgi:hypothetical protein